MNLPGKLILALSYLFTHNGRYLARSAGAAPGLAGSASSSTPKLGQTHEDLNDNSYNRNLNNSNNYESQYIPAKPPEPPPAAPSGSATSSRYDQSFGMAPKMSGTPQAHTQQARQVSAVPVSQTPGASPQAASAVTPRQLPHYAQFFPPAQAPSASQPPKAAPQPVKLQPTEEPKLVIFDINEKKSTNYIIYTLDNQTGEDVFTPKSPHSIYKVTNRDTVVWTSSNHLYPEEVRVMVDERGEPRVRIFFPQADQQAKPAKASVSKESVPLETGHVTSDNGQDSYTSHLTTVEVDSKKSTNKIKYERDEAKMLERFTAKAPYMIERVTKSGKTIWPHGKLIEPCLKLVIRKTKSGKDRLKVFFFEDEDEDDEEDEQDPEFGFQPRVVPQGTHYGFTAPQQQHALPQLPQLHPLQPQTQHPAQLKPVHPPQLQPVVPQLVKPQAPQQPVSQQFGDEPFESESRYEVDFDQIIGAQSPYATPQYPQAQYPQYAQQQYSQQQLAQQQYYQQLQQYQQQQLAQQQYQQQLAQQQYQQQLAQQQQYAQQLAQQQYAQHVPQQLPQLPPFQPQAQQVPQLPQLPRVQQHVPQLPQYQPQVQQPAHSAYPYGYPQQYPYPQHPQPIHPGQQVQFPGYPGQPIQQVQLPAHPGQLYPAHVTPQRASPESEEQPYQDILLLTKDPNTNKSVLLHRDLYDVKDYSNNIIEYSLSQHARCTSIRYNKKPIWKHYPREYGDSYPQIITHNKNTDKISIHFKEFIILYQRDSNGTWNDTEYDLRLFTQNPRDKRTIIEMDSTQYTLTKVGDEKYQFVFKSGVTCSEVHIDDQIVWKIGEFQLKKPLLVSYHEQLDEIAVGNQEKLLVYYKLDDGWPFYRTKYINGHRRPITGNTARDRGLPYTSSPGDSED